MVDPPESIMSETFRRFPFCAIDELEIVSGRVFIIPLCIKTFSGQVDRFVDFFALQVRDGVDEGLGGAGKFTLLIVGFAQSGADAAGNGVEFVLGTEAFEDLCGLRKLFVCEVESARCIEGIRGIFVCRIEIGEFDITGASLVLVA